MLLTISLPHTSIPLSRSNEEMDTNSDLMAAKQEDTGNAIEQPMSLHQQRLETVAEILKNSGARRVLDLGCGDGKLLDLLLKEKQFSEIVGMDISHSDLEIASRRLHLDQLSNRQRKRIQLIQGSLIYYDKRLCDYDAAAVVEVIEHLDLPRLEAFEHMLFEFARPSMVVITTPNQEYNNQWPHLTAGKFRHGDHRFEWTRDEFQTWANQVGDRYGYAVEFHPIGLEVPEVGAPTQMGIFAQSS